MAMCCRSVKLGTCECVDVSFECLKTVDIDVVVFQKALLSLTEVWKSLEEPAFVVKD